MTPVQLWAVAVTGALAIAPAPLPAQTPESLEDIPVIPGSHHDTKGERLLPPPDSTHEVRLYRIAASIEEVFKWYHYHLGGESGPSPDAPTAQLASDGITPVTYHIEFHQFNDECADTPQDSAPDSTCHTWHRGKDKRRALGLSRLPWDTGQWIADVTFTWFCRDADGTLRRLRVEIRDIGLKPDWKYYTPLGEVRIESTALSGR